MQKSIAGYLHYCPRRQVILFKMHSDRAVFSCIRVAVHFDAYYTTLGSRWLLMEFVCVWFIALAK